jgi:hypothetical protein
MAQGTEFPLRKPAGFHWDIFLLGLTTGVAGLLGLPFPNGLIPQAPFHTNALCVYKTVTDEHELHKGHARRVVDHVVEQRFSNLAQGLLTLGTMTGPLLIVIHLIPQGVLAGLFFVMGVQALQANGITSKLFFLLEDKEMTPKREPLLQITRRPAIWYFVALELFGFGATFAITQTIAAIGFPIIILLLIPARVWLLPRYFSHEELRVLDAPTASPFTMESVGGNYGEVLEDLGEFSDPNANAPNEAIDEGKESPPTEPDDLAEQGVALGFSESQSEGRYSTRRRSTRRSNDTDHIELASIRSSLRRTARGKSEK